MSDLITRLREATTVLDEPFHHDAIAVTLLEAADALEAAHALVAEWEAETRHLVACADYDRADGRRECAAQLKARLTAELQVKP